MAHCALFAPTAPAAIPGGRLNSTLPTLAAEASGRIFRLCTQLQQKLPVQPSLGQSKPARAGRAFAQWPAEFLFPPFLGSTSRFAYRSSPGKSNLIQPIPSPLRPTRLSRTPKFF